MHSTLETLINHLHSPAIDGTNVIPWACPIPSFGDLSRARVATLGINPSNLEFEHRRDGQDKELEGKSRRFHTLRSLEIGSWSEVQARHLEKILELCREYFSPCRNPYDRWFKPLDQVVKGAQASFYDASSPACHLDLVPYATKCKWRKLSGQQQKSLLGVSADTLARLLRNSPVRILILNGKRVVEQFQKLADIRLESRQMPSWTLHWESGPREGVSYKGVVNTLSGVDFEREILVLGFSHNHKGTHGMTNEVIDAISKWIAQASEEAPQ